MKVRGERYKVEMAKGMEYVLSGTGGGVSSGRDEEH